MYESTQLDTAKQITISDLLDDMESYEMTKSEWLEEQDHVYYQACRDAILIKSITGR